MAAPFVQGRLRNEALTVDVETRCGHCDEPMAFTIDHEMVARGIPAGAVPLLSIPLVDIRRLKDPSIIHAF